MRTIYSLIFVSLLSASLLLAGGKDNEIQKKSGDIPPLPTTPQPFQIVGNSHNSPAISTGYYFVDSDDNVPAFWQPTEQPTSLDNEPERWRKIFAGPRVADTSQWADSEEGLRFFRNPAHPTQDPGNYFADNDFGQDTTDNAIAGPIPLKLVGGFYFNGIRYDSFYVTTNGLVALTNRRYFYDQNGNRYIPPGESSAYDPNSMDWFRRGRSGNGLSDNTPDNFGYQYSILGNNPNNANAGIRGGSGSNNGISASLSNISSVNDRAAVIAFMYGDNELSQYSKNQTRVDGHGQVWYKRSFTNDKLIIYFINLARNGTVHAVYQNPYNLGEEGDFDGANLRPGDDNYVSVTGQVVLNRNDSSITMIYERFRGNIRIGTQTATASQIFRYNSVIGVRGFARHANYNRYGGPGPNDNDFPWVSEYQQYTHYMSGLMGGPPFGDRHRALPYPRNGLTIKFKEYQNTLRVADIQYRVRKQDPNANLDFSEEVRSTEVQDYELLAGNDHLGAIQPIALIQNLSNDIQGPVGTNFVEQDVNFQARFRIVNAATGRIVYNRLVPVDDRCLKAAPGTQDCNGNPDVLVRLVNVTVDDGDYITEEATYPGTNSWNGRTRTGIPPYHFAEIKFPPFEPNEFARDENGKLYQIGRMNAFVISDATNPTDGKKLGDEWPFDDTASVRLHVMKLHDFFADDVREYHLIEGVPIPSVQKWVSIDAEVVSGDVVSRHPLPPRGDYSADNNPNFFITDPAILMNRKDLVGGDNSPGDILSSHPIDMRGRFNSVISLSVQRTRDEEFWDRGYGDNALVGPEPRAVLNQDPFVVWDHTNNAASANPDMLMVQIMRPSNNGVADITNVDDKNWSIHPRRGGADAVDNVPALGIFGAGGYLTGFLESDKDSSLSLPNANNRYLNSLRANIFDDGYDFTYKKYFVPIPDTFITWQNSGAKHFRFRIKMNASDDMKCITCIPDDDDDFIVDNIRVLFETTEATDVEVNNVRIIWPYTETPATQATKIPIRVGVSNNTVNNAPFYYVLVKVFRQGDSDPVYCYNRVITSHVGNAEKDITFPPFNARGSGEGEYRAQAIVFVPGGDLEELNDTTYTDFELNFGSTFAYDPVESPQNDIGTFAGMPAGRGLNTEAFAYGGLGRANAAAENYAANIRYYGAGWIGGSISGQIGMKFKLLQADTVFGYQAFFGVINQAPDAIALSVYNGTENSNVPTNVIDESVLERQRGRDDRTDKLSFGEYVQYNLRDPLILQPGVYWATIAQLGETGLELGGSAQRAGLRTMSPYVQPPIFATQPTGGSGISLNVHKEFRKFANQGTNLINDNYFAFENTRGNGEWVPFTPSVGNIAYAHTHHFGTATDNQTLTLTNGTWIPMIRPYMREKSAGNNLEYVTDCYIPIELTDFKGDTRNNAVDLYWTTASEENNKGFYIERRHQVNKEFTDWEQITFVNGNGTTPSESHYTFTDRDVKTNTKYEYRLRQVDFDGTQSCFETRIVTAIIEGDFDISVGPNPVQSDRVSTINYSLSHEANVKIEIVDLYGNVVRTYNEGIVNNRNNQVVFDGTDDNGMKLPSGTYIYRVTADGKTQSDKLNIIR